MDQQQQILKINRFAFVRPLFSKKRVSRSLTLTEKNNKNTHCILLCNSTGSRLPYLNIKLYCACDTSENVTRFFSFLFSIVIDVRLTNNTKGNSGCMVLFPCDAGFVRGCVPCLNQVSGLIKNPVPFLLSKSCIRH